MAGNSLIFKNAEKARDAILDSQKKEIASLYEKWADDIAEKARWYSHKTTASSVVSERQMKELYKQLTETSHQVSNEVYGKIKQNIYTVADAVVADNTKWLAKFGFSAEGINAAFSHVPDNIVRNLITGQIYDSGWSLSSRIWSDNEKTLKDIYQVVARGVAENKPIYEIAKDLESYVRPGVKLPWNLKMKDGARIYKKQVDYNAQRLARTLVQHGYQQSFVATTIKNPFIIDYIWIANGSRTCDLCEDRDGQHFDKDDLPLDHPNGMCTMEPNVDDNMVDKIADWYNSPDGTYPDIDEFAKGFGYNPSNTSKVQDFISKYGTSTKNPDAWYQSLSSAAKAEAKMLKDESGLTWKQWYKNNIYKGKPEDFDRKSKVNWFNNYKDIMSKQDLTKMDKWTDDWLTKVSTEEASAVRTITGHAYKDINGFLRGFRSATDYEDEIKLIDSALKKAKLPENVIVRRGSDYNVLESIGYTRGSDTSKFIGALVKDEGFLSTSPSMDGGFANSIEYIINVPKGSQGMYISYISRFPSEFELLLNKGGKFTIDKVIVNEWGDAKQIFMTLTNLK